MSVFSGLLQRLGHGILKLLPDRTKRAIFVSTVTAAATNTSDLDDETLGKLNELFSLCASTKSMGLPVALSKVIWDGTTIHDVGDAVERTGVEAGLGLETVLSKFREQVPGWLNYGDERMDADLHKLVEHRFGTR